jgi:diaminohydroxyphosphoribosylaminopyrimidine deaminase/5-amino-6-(5-phosphoribosylamino)uracil reductase
VARRRPHVTWKYAASLDGLTAAADGTSQWITGPDARRDVHRERFLVDAVIVGIGTVLADDPSLTVRDWPAARQPLRVVVDSDARTPLSSRAVDGSAPSVVIAADDAPSETVTTLRANGVDVVQVPRRNGHVDPASVLATLGEREVLLALLEGGATLASAFLRDGLIDRVVAYQAPLLLGTGTPVLGDVGVPTLAAARQVEVDEVSRIGRDLRIVARVTAGRP